MRSARSILLTVVMLSGSLAALTARSIMSALHGVEAKPTAAHSANTEPTVGPDAIGISFAQITDTFDTDFHFAPTSPSQGFPRSKAVNRNEPRTATMFVTGSESNIHDAQLFVDIPHGSREVTGNEASMAVRFAKNAMPGWSDAEKWITHNSASLLRRARHHTDIPSTSIVRDNKRLVLVVLPKPGVLAIDVTHE